MKKWNLIHLTIFQNQWNELNGQHTEIKRQAEGHFGEHGMHIGMPENKPATKGLPNINGQDQKCRTVADKPDDNGQINNIFQFVNAKHIFQQTGEKGPAANGNDGKIRPDPQGKSIIVIHVGLVQAFKPAQPHGINAPQHDYTNHRDPGGKHRERTAVCALRY